MAKKYVIDLPIGDWSNDGHGRCDNFIIESNKPIEALFKAYFAAQGKLPKLIHPNNICSQYEQNTISNEVLTQMRAYGFVYSNSVDNDDDENYLETEELASWTLIFMMLGDKNLKLKIKNEKEIPKFINWNAPKGKQLDQIGYGLFC